MQVPADAESINCCCCFEYVQEAESTQEALVALRRQHEELTSKHKALEMTSTASVTVAGAQHAAEVAELQARIRTLSARTPAGERAAQLEAALQAAEAAGAEQAAVLAKVQAEAAQLR